MRFLFELSPKSGFDVLDERANPPLEPAAESAPVSSHGEIAEFTLRIEQKNMKTFPVSCEFSKTNVHESFHISQKVANFDIDSNIQNCQFFLKNRIKLTADIKKWSLSHPGLLLSHPSLNVP